MEVTMLKDRKKGQRSKFGSAPAPVEHEEHNVWGKFGGIAPIPPAPVEGQGSRVKVKWGLLADKSCTSVATWRIGRVLVAPYDGESMHECCRLVDKSRTNITQIRASYFLKWCHLVDRSCISVASLRTIHELILSKFVCLIFF